ncbi:MAG: hypothetical protein JW901_01190 [Dehalococcoidia bacterium]|nr:hypothetical protein [Dehalococcoidia bacterium]
MSNGQLQGAVLQGARRIWVFALLGATLLLAGSVFGVDWTNYFYGTGSLYPAIAKPGITLLSMIIVLIAGRYALERKDWTLLLLAFCCMLPTDILMSVVVAVPGMTVGGLTFMIGGVLSIIAHIFLIIRVGRGFGYFKSFKLAEIWLPVLIYGSAVVVMLVLWNDVVRVGHAVIGPAYTAFFCTTTWLAWETVRRKLYPAPNAWMVAIAATCWYATEITGEVYNLGLGNISQVMFCLVWVFYGTNVVLWALSGYRWK